MAKFIKMYVTTEDVSKRLSDPYTDREVAFTDAHITQDGSVEFTAVLTDDSVENDTNPRRSKFEFDKGAFHKGSKVGLTGRYDMKDKEQLEILGTEASRKCLADAIDKLKYTAKDLLNEVSLSWDNNIINELADKNCSTIKHNISILTKVGFDILYNQDTNEFIIKNMEHVTELNGGSVEETNKIREKAEAIINDTMSMVEAIDVMLGTDD